MHWRVRNRAFTLAACCLAGAILRPAAPLRAEVHFDGSVGKTKLTPADGPFSNVPFSAGDKRGGNLFHSFQSFKVNPGETVTFKGAQPGDVPAGDAVKVSNILARVTGGQASQINGTIKSEITGANLYLLNPNGVVFGNGASLSISGSFFASTAKEVRFGSAGALATRQQTPVPAGLTLPPTGFGFSGTPASIKVDQATLTGAPGTTLGLLGGDVQVTGGSLLHVDGGEVHLASVTRGELIFSHLAGRTMSRLAPGSVGGEVRVEDSFLGDSGAATSGTGLSRLTVQAGRLAISGSEIWLSAQGAGDGLLFNLQRDLAIDSSLAIVLAFGDLREQPIVNVSARAARLGQSFLAVSPVDPGQGGDLKLTIAGRLELQQSTIAVVNDGTTASGNLFVEAGSAVLDTGVITASSSAPAKPGRFEVRVSGELAMVNASEISFGAASGTMAVSAATLTMRGESTFLFNDFTPGQASGTLRLDVSGRLTVLEGSQIQAIGSRRAGRDMEIHAGSALLSGTGVDDRTSTGIIASSNGPQGARGGQIHLTVDGALEVLDGATISSNTIGPGNGGSIFIQADRVTVTGRPGVPGTFITPRGITAQNKGEIGGPSGSIEIDAREVEVSQEGEINASTQGTGRGGSITVRGDEMTVGSGGRVIAETTGRSPLGRGGDVQLSLSDVLLVQAGGSVSVSTLGTAPGGNLSISADTVQIDGVSAEIAARSGSPTQQAGGRGGNVSISAQQLEISRGAQLTASTYGLASGGNVLVEADRLTIRESSPVRTGISAQTVGGGQSGTGGRVQIQAGTVELTGAGAVISSSSAGSGDAGSISLRTSTLTMSLGSSIQSSSATAGLAGSVLVEAQRRIDLRSGSNLSVAAAQSSAGDLQLMAGDTISLERSSLTSQAALTGGSILVEAGRLVFLRDSRITAAAQSSGGNIEIDPELIVLDRSLIDARAVLLSGGNIHLQSDFLINSPESLITATSQRGIDGEVNIDALNIDLTGSLVELPSRLLDAESQLRELCTMKLDDFSSFVRQGRGGVPPLPGAPLRSLEIIP